MQKENRWMSKTILTNRVSSQRKTLIVFIITLALLIQASIGPTPLNAEETNPVDLEIYAETTPSSSIKSGNQFNLKLTVLLKAGEPEDTYTISLQLGPNFKRVTNEVLTKDLTWAGQTAEVDFDLIYDGGPNDSIKVSVVKDPDGKLVSEKTVWINVEQSSRQTSDDDDDDDIPVDTTKYVPILNFTNSSVITGYAGERVRVSLRLKNTSTYTAKNIRISPVLEDSPFMLDSTNAVQNISRMRSGEIEEIRYYFRISPDAEQKVYPLKFNFEYYNNYDDHFGGSASPRSDTVYIRVNNDNLAPRLGIVGVNVTSGTDESIPANVLNTELKISNQGTLPAEDIKVTLIGLKDDGFGLYQDSNLKSIPEIPGNGEATVHFALWPSSAIGKGNYGLIAKIDYKDQSGNEYSDEHQFFVPLEKSVSGGSVPKIILHKYSSNPAIVKAGENFTLNLSFLNTSPEKTVNNIKIFFTVPDGGAESSGSVFSPVNSSNTIFIDSIPPKSIYHRTLEFYTIPDANPKTYTLTANFEYEDDSGSQYEATELIGIPVSQQTKLETSEIILPPEVFLGEPVPVSLDFYNTGKAKLNNLMLKLEGDFETQNGSYYVGNFEVGASDYFEAMIIPNSPGLLEGAIRISYEEPSGEQIEISHDFTLNVTEMPMPEFPPGFEPEFEQPSGPSVKTWILAGIGLLLFIIVMVILVKKGVFKKLINRKKGLTLDE